VIPRSDWQQVLNFINFIFENNTKEAVLLINQLVEEGVDLEHFTYTTIESLRKILLAKITLDWQEVSWEFGEDNLKQLVKNVENVSATRLVEITEVFLKAFSNIKKTRIIQLPLEMAVVELTQKSEEAEDDNFKPQPPSTTAKPKLDSSTKSSVKPEPTKPNTAKSEVNLKQVKQKWPEIIEALKAYNHSLATFLMVGNPTDVRENKIVVSFKYNFHYERIREPKNLDIVKEVLEKTFFTKLSLEGNIDEATKPATSASSSPTQKAPSDNDGMIDEVLNTLGGEVIG